MEYNKYELNYIKELIKHKLSKTNPIALEAIELDMEIPLEITKNLIKELIDFLIIKEFITLDFRDYDKFLTIISKGVVEILILSIGTKEPMDMPYLVTRLLIEELELDKILDRLNLMFISKELESILVSMVSQFDIIIDSLKKENMVLTTIRNTKAEFSLIPKKWLTISLPILYSKDHTEFETIKLKIDLIEG